MILVLLWFSVFFFKLNYRIDGPNFLPFENKKKRISGFEVSNFLRPWSLCLTLSLSHPNHINKLAVMSMLLHFHPECLSQDALGQGDQKCNASKSGLKFYYCNAGAICLLTITVMSGTWSFTCWWCCNCIFTNFSIMYTKKMVLL